MIALIAGIGAVIAHIEKMPFGDALYFFFITGLTIEYGDIVVNTPVGRILAVLRGLIGIVITGIMIAAAIRSVAESMNDIKKSKN
ncbi:MAG: two pore domain potassium channel family protein [bacterium]|nr:two pore domain potassium channel family protein [bacterium]